MPKSLTLIKLGGSVITNKEVPMMVREGVLARLAAEIARARSQPDTDTLIIGHGQGSFAHAPALRYKTMDGFINDESVIGMAITQDSAAQLNRIVVKAFLAEQLPAVSFLFSNTIVTAKGKSAAWCGHVLDEYLQNGLLPITGGDVLVDQEQGCTIWSTEKVLAHLASEFVRSEKYTVRRIIHVTEVDGILDPAGSLVPEVTEQNVERVSQMITAAKGFDVTGGMGHKLEESMALARDGIESYIISGLTKDNLYKALIGHDWVGTRIIAKKYD